MSNDQNPAGSGEDDADVNPACTATYCYWPDCSALGCHDPGLVLHEGRWVHPDWLRTSGEEP